MTTILTETNETRCDTASVEGNALWLPESELEAASGFALREEGFCRGELCVPVPPGRESEFSADGRANVSALWAQLGWPTARTRAGDAWVLGEGAAANTERLRGAVAPEFTLPDFDGVSHALSEWRGKKLLLVTWASW